MKSTVDNNSQPHTFDLIHTLHEIKHYLPSQMTLKDFVHHNSLHAFQDMKFYEGIFRASKIFGYKVTLELDDFRRLFRLGRIKEHVIQRIIEERKGAAAMTEWSNNLLSKKYDENIDARIGKLRSNWKQHYKIDLDTLVQPYLYRILCAYLDQGISLWNFPAKASGLVDAIRDLENNSSVSFFKTNKAKEIFLGKSANLHFLLQKLVGDESYYEQYLFDLAFSHRGWAGMIAVIDDNPATLLIKKPCTFEDFLILALCMELDMLYLQFGEKWEPIANFAKGKPIEILSKTTQGELQDVFKIWQDAFEWSYYDDVFGGIKSNLDRPSTDQEKKKFQAIFCIDERECSIRRHIEYVQPACETLGAPGFFGVEFYFEQSGAKFIDKLCPAPVTPKYLIKELDRPHDYASEHHKHDTDIMLNTAAHNWFQSIVATFGLGALSFVKIFQGIFRPKMSPSISDAFDHMTANSLLSVENKSLSDRENDLQVGFTIEEMTLRVENLLRGIGLIKNFSDIVYLMAHGSSSANNPHHGAHDCGACSGRPGGTNSRVFAVMANHPAVRASLKTNGIIIPENTLFVAAMHDTASDQIGFYDEPSIPASHKALHLENKASFEAALDLNAKERSRRFASISTNQDIKSIRKAILDRSVSLFEPRPELGHGTNSLAIIGRREVTRGLFMDRRAFMNSYDYRTDPEGKYLTNVMGPIGVVCGGINLEYYFSRVDNMKLGCGTKLPHNVMGLLGVANSSDGDLRPGLPWQMIEPHDPVRLLVIVEHFPEVVLKVIKSNEAMYEWYKNEWVHIAALNPETKEFFYFKDEQFLPYHVNPIDVKAVENVHHIFENAPEMMTNHISDATFENLPIYQITNVAPLPLEGE